MMARAQVAADKTSRAGRQSKPRSPRRGPAPPEGTSPARRRAAVILEVLAGVLRPSEAAETLGTSLPRYYQLERRALAGLLRACEPMPRGPRADATRQLAELERENRRLKRDCDRQQALVRMAGLVSPAVKPAAKANQESKADGKRRRRRRASVRALQVVRGLRSDDEAASPNGETADIPSLASN